MTVPALGSGARFRKLSGTLAAKGAHNPDALAAWIGRRKFGAKKFGALSAHNRGSSHSSPGMAGLLFAGSRQLECPNCGYRSDDADFQIKGGTAGTTDKGSPGALRTPANPGLQSATGYSPATAGMNVRSGPGGAGLSNSQPGLEFAGSHRMPVASPSDIVVSRGADGRAVIRHRRGGDKIGEIWRTQDGSWKSSLEGGGDLADRTHQRTALGDLIGNWNKTSVSPHRPASDPLQPPPQQTGLMRQFGIPAVRALATPANGDDDGPRVTGSSEADELSPRGKGVYSQLRKKGWPHPRAHAFAKRAQAMAAKAG